MADLEIIDIDFEKMEPGVTYIEVDGAWVPLVTVRQRETCDRCGGPINGDSVSVQGHERHVECLREGPLTRWDALRADREEQS